MFDTYTSSKNAGSLFRVDGIPVSTIPLEVI
jgi:hypothetical protein